LGRELRKREVSMRMKMAKMSKMAGKTKESMEK